jgi:O-antigen/teichoic acid export membrane protein
MPLLIGVNYLNDSLRLLPAIGFLLVINAIYLFYISLAFQIAKQTQKTIWIVGFATVLNIILNFILIPYYQIEGAIIASLVAYLFCVVYGYMVSMKYFKMPILWWELLKLIIAASLMLILLNYLPIDIGLIEGFIRIVVGLCFYLAMIWLLNVGKARLFLACFLKTMNKQNESTHYQA